MTDERIEKIKGHIGHIRTLVLELFERRGWEVLGYGSWRECVLAEFPQSQSRLYELLTEAQVDRNISDVSENQPVTARVAKELKHLSPEQQREVVQKAKETAPDGKINTQHVQKVIEAEISEDPTPRWAKKKAKKPVAAPEIPPDDPYSLAQDDDRLGKIFEQVDDAYNEFFPQIVSQLKEEVRPCDWGLALQIIVQEQWQIKAMDPLRREFKEFDEKRRRALRKYNSQLRKSQ